MENFAAFQDVSKEEVPEPDAPPDRLRPENDQIQTEVAVDRLPDKQRLFILSPSSHDDEKVHIALWTRVPASVTAEQDDLERREPSYDLVDNPPDG